VFSPTAAVSRFRSPLPPQVPGLPTFYPIVSLLLCRKGRDFLNPPLCIVLLISFSNQLSPHLWLLLFPRNLFLGGFSLLLLLGLYTCSILSITFLLESHWVNVLLPFPAESYTFLFFNTLYASLFSVPVLAFRTASTSFYCRVSLF